MRHSPCGARARRKSSCSTNPSPWRPGSVRAVNRQYSATIRCHSGDLLRSRLSDHRCDLDALDEALRDGFRESLPTNRQLAWRVPFIDHEIQNGAQLTVREGQLAVFLDQGTLADHFGPGLHTLDTANLPILTNLMHWDKGFKSPFKSDVVFFRQSRSAHLCATPCRRKQLLDSENFSMCVKIAIG